MSYEPKPKRQKMEFDLGGDDSSVESDQTSQFAASKCLENPSRSPSGDFGTVGSHEYVTLVSNVSSEDVNSANKNNTETCRQGCEYGDYWRHDYPRPLSTFPTRPFRAGTLWYDSVIKNMDKVGYRPLQVVANRTSGIVILAQNTGALSVSRTESEITPVGIKIHSKIYHRLRGETTSVSTETDIHKVLHHPNIVTWLDDFNFDGRKGIVMEFCEGGNLEQLVNANESRFLTERVARGYFRQIVSAVQYVHVQGYAHRDISLQNVLITQNNVPKLCDFGHAVRFQTGDSLCEGMSGSPGYQAPEILKETPYNPKLSDVWSLGALLYIMCVGRWPMGSSTEEVLENAARSVKFPDQATLRLSDELKMLIKGQLMYQPHDRFSMCRISRSEWLTQADDKVQIGNFYKVCQPKKLTEGFVGAQEKESFYI